MFKFIVLLKIVKLNNMIVKRIFRLVIVVFFLGSFIGSFVFSYREVFLIVNDLLVDNMDVYVFWSFDDFNIVMIIVNYIFVELLYGGFNYYIFGENICYEVYIDNDVICLGDEIIY